MEESERRKAIELLKEMRNENTADDKKSGQEVRLSWMYKGPSDLVDREEYLLGKTIDKTFEVLNSGGSSDVVGRTGEQSNVPKRLLEKTDSNEQVDIAKKILEDPLYAIKQKEMEARKKLLNNPVKLKQIKQMLLERSKQYSAHKKNKKKLKKKSEQDLNLLILKKLKKFTFEEKRKALNKIMHTEPGSTESSSSEEKKKKKKKRKLKRKKSSSSDESDSSSETSSVSDESEKSQKHKKKKAKSEPKKRKQSSDSDSSEDKRREKKSKKSKKNHRKSSDDSSDSSTSSSDDDEKNNKVSNNRHNSKPRHPNRDFKDRGRSRRNERAEEYHKGKDRRSKRDAAESSSSARNYGLMMPDGSKPEVKGRHSPVRKYDKGVQPKAKYVPPPVTKPLSEKERAEKLNEMMKDAKERKKDREKNLASHRKKLDQEEELMTYDDDFMRRQMSHLTSQGTITDRIKSNINNIQRSKSSMETSFMKK